MLADVTSNFQDIVCTDIRNLDNMQILQIYCFRILKNAKR